MISLFPGLQADDVYFLIIAVTTLVVVFMLVRNSLHHNKFASRVKALQDRRVQLKAELLAPRKRSKKASPAMSANLIRKIVNNMNLLQKSQTGKINKMLINAGYRSKDAIFVFTFFQLISPIVVLGMALFVADIDFSDPFAVKWKPIFVAASAYFGLKLPGIFVINSRNKRYSAIQKGLSDTLDLLLICAEAGLSLGAAFVRVGRELGNTYPEIAEELGLTSIELGFLPDRKKALSNLIERVDMPEMRGIVGVLMQTEKYGTPVAQALRVFAAEFRQQRMLRAEQKAARLPALLTLPMVIFILPPLFVVILSPALIRMSHNLAGSSLR